MCVLFMNWARREEFDAVVDAVIDALAAEGIELAADWRAHDAVVLDIGPVLHADDAVANKMAALYGRALARDFLDADAILASDRYSQDRLLGLAAEADAGFDLGTDHGRSLRRVRRIRRGHNRHAPALCLLEKPPSLRLALTSHSRLGRSSSALREQREDLGWAVPAVLVGGLGAHGFVLARHLQCPDRTAAAASAAPVAPAENRCSVPGGP